MSKIAIVVGATGVVGRELVSQLCQNTKFNKVVCLVRTPMSFQHNKLEQVEVDFTRLNDWQVKLSGDVLFCALGTTLKQAGSKKQQQKIDLELPVTIAKAAKEQGVSSFALVSSTGANSSATSFYLSLKGQLENALTALNFDQLTIVRPSVLVGHRNEFRLGEEIAVKVLRLLSFLPWVKRYRPISGSEVAKSLIHFQDKNSGGAIVKELDELFV